jgi:hypothetical protein
MTTFVGAETIYVQTQGTCNVTASPVLHPGRRRINAVQLKAQVVIFCVLACVFVRFMESCAP